MSGSDQKLELTYPCQWDYKVVVISDFDIKLFIQEIVCDREHTLKKSKTSAKGKYQSYNLSILVHNDDDRVTIFEELQKNSNVKMVI